MKQCIFSILLFVFAVPICSAVNFCDDGKRGIEIDLHGDSDWKCPGEKWSLKEDIKETEATTNCYPHDRTYHVCIDKDIDHLYPSDDVPNRGPHREVWAAYGEHKYVPPGRFVHNLEHGAVVFLYHPCTPDEMVNQLRTVAETCTWKYILSAYPNLTQEYPLAVLTYSCVYKMSRIKSDNISQWVRDNVKKSPEVNVYGQGHYNHSLIKLSSKPIEIGEEKKKEFCPAVPEPKTTTHVPHTPSPTPTPRTDEVFWAVGSLVFLCFLLTVAICYTKLWRSRPGYDASEPKYWVSSDNHGSVTVAAVVKKLPNMVKTKLKGSQSASNRYTLIEDSMSATDEEL